MKKRLPIYLLFLIVSLFLTPNIQAACNPPVDYTSCIDQYPDYNLNIRGWESISGHLGLIPFDHPIDPGAPQLSTLVEGNTSPAITSLRQIYDWNWNINARGGLYRLADAPADFATLVGFAANGNILVPESGYDLGGFEVLVLFATNNQILLKYTLEDSIVSGYAIHLMNLSINPDLVAYYNELNSQGREKLPALLAGEIIGSAGGEVWVAIRDTGSFMDPRWINDWWQTNNPGSPKPFTRKTGATSRTVSPLLPATCEPAEPGQNQGVDCAGLPISLPEKVIYYKSDPACIIKNFQGEIHFDNYDLPFAKTVGDYFTGLFDIDHYSLEMAPAALKACMANGSCLLKNTGVSKKLLSKNSQDTLKLQFLQETQNRFNNHTPSRYEEFFQILGKQPEAVSQQYLTIKDKINKKGEESLNAEEKDFLAKIWPFIPLFANEETEGAIVGSGDGVSFSNRTSIPEVFRLNKATALLQKLLYSSPYEPAGARIKGPIIAAPQGTLLAQAGEVGNIPHGCKYFYADAYQDCSCMATHSCRGEHSGSGCCPPHYWWGICGWEDCQPDIRCSPGELTHACPGDSWAPSPGPVDPCPDTPETGEEMCQKESVPGPPQTAACPEVKEDGQVAAGQFPNLFGQRTFDNDCTREERPCRSDECTVSASGCTYSCTDGYTAIEQSCMPPTTCTCTCVKGSGRCEKNFEVNINVQNVVPYLESISEQAIGLVQGLFRVFLPRLYKDLPAGQNELGDAYKEMAKPLPAEDSYVGYNLSINQVDPNLIVPRSQAGALKFMFAELGTVYRIKNWLAGKVLMPNQDISSYFRQGIQAAEKGFPQSRERTPEATTIAWSKYTKSGPLLALDGDCAGLKLDTLLFAPLPPEGKWLAIRSFKFSSSSQDYNKQIDIDIFDREGGQGNVEPAQQAPNFLTFVYNGNDFGIDYGRGLLVYDGYAEVRVVFGGGWCATYDRENPFTASIEVEYAHLTPEEAEAANLYEWWFGDKFMDKTGNYIIDGLFDEVKSGIITLDGLFSYSTIPTNIGFILQGNEFLRDENFSTKEGDDHVRYAKNTGYSASGEFEVKNYGAGFTDVVRNRIFVHAWGER
jgi:hypothetical protein